MIKRQDKPYDLWITDDDNWQGRWVVYEILCSHAHSWCEVMPIYAKPDVCPICGDLMITIEPGLYEAPRH